MASLAVALVVMLVTTSLGARMALQADALVAMLLANSMQAVVASLEATGSVRLPGGADVLRASGNPCGELKCIRAKPHTGIGLL